jgi:hypothetical protein
MKYNKTILRRINKHDPLLYKLSIKHYCKTYNNKLLLLWGGF